MSSLPQGGATLNPEDAARAAAAAFKEGSAVPFVGSGLSACTGLPSAWAFASQLVATIDERPRCKPRLSEADREAICQLPFESMMQTITIVWSTPDFVEHFAVFGQGQCGPLQHRLAALMHLNDRPVAFTTNFDRLIEQACSRLTSVRTVHKLEDYAAPPAASEVILFKLHGSSDHPESILATVNDVANPLPRAKSDALYQSTEGKSVIFLGYSGSDPDILSELDRLNCHSIYWICAPGSPRDGVSERVHELSAQGKVTLIRADLAEFLEMAAEFAGTAPSPSTSPPPTSFAQHFADLWDTKPNYFRLWTLGLLCRQAARWESGEEILRLLARAIPKDDERLRKMRRASVYDKWADVAFRSRRFSQAKRRWNRAQSLARQISWLPGIIGAYAGLSGLQNERAALAASGGQIEATECVRLCKEGLEILARTAEDMEMQALAPPLRAHIAADLHQNMGIALMHLSRFDDAIAALINAERAYFEAEQPVMHAFTRLDLELASALAGLECDEAEALGHAKFVENYGTLEQGARAFCDLARLLSVVSSPERDWSLHRSASLARRANDTATLAQVAALTRAN